MGRGTWSQTPPIVLSSYYQPSAHQAQLIAELQTNSESRCQLYPTVGWYTLETEETLPAPFHISQMAAGSLCLEAWSAGSQENLNVNDNSDV
jgi:hypothetical protein